MLLDEPTNHLDIAAREAIEAFLAESPATLIVVSHDRRLLETICERLWVVDDGLAVPFDGGYRAWRAAVGEGWTVEAEAKRRANRGRPGAARRRRGRDDGAPVRTRTPDDAVRRRRSRPRLPQPPRPAPVRRARNPARSCPRTRIVAGSEVLDAELARLGLRKTQLELAMTNPAVAANFVEMRRVTSELADVERALGEAENAWLQLEEQAP